MEVSVYITLTMYKVSISITDETFVYHSRCTQQYPRNFFISGRHSSWNIQFAFTILSSEVVLHPLSPAAATEVRRIQPPSSKWWRMLLRIYATGCFCLEHENKSARDWLQLLGNSILAISSMLSDDIHACYPMIYYNMHAIQWSNDGQ